MRTNEGVEGIKLGNWNHLMEIYADDVSLFLEPSAQNLRNVINILKDF